VFSFELGLGLPRCARNDISIYSATRTADPAIGGSSTSILIISLRPQRSPRLIKNPHVAFSFFLSGIRYYLCANFNH